MTEIWIKQKENAEDFAKLRMIAVVQNRPIEDHKAIVEHRFNGVPDTSDDRGDYLVHIGDSGESKEGGNY